MSDVLIVGPKLGESATAECQKVLSKGSKVTVTLWHKAIREFYCRLGKYDSIVLLPYHVNARYKSLKEDSHARMDFHNALNTYLREGGLVTLVHPVPWYNFRKDRLKIAKLSEKQGTRISEDNWALLKSSDEPKGSKWERVWKTLVLEPMNQLCSFVKDKVGIHVLHLPRATDFAEDGLADKVKKYLQSQKLLETRYCLSGKPMWPVCWRAGLPERTVVDLQVWGNRGKLLNLPAQTPLKPKGLGCAIQAAMAAARRTILHVYWGTEEKRYKDNIFIEGTSRKRLKLDSLYCRVLKLVYEEREISPREAARVLEVKMNIIKREPLRINDRFNEAGLVLKPSRVMIAGGGLWHLSSDAHLVVYSSSHEIRQLLGVP